MVQADCIMGVWIGGAQLGPGGIGSVIRRNAGEGMRVVRQGLPKAVAGLFLWLLFAGHLGAEAGHKESAVVVEAAPIKGRVFICTQRAEDDEVPARNVTIQVWGQKNRRLLQTTHTGKEGYFSLSKLEVGKYGLRIGRLRLKMEVIPSGDPRVAQLPKVIIVILPRELLR